MFAIDCDSSQSNAMNYIFKELVLRFSKNEASFGL